MTEMYRPRRRTHPVSAGAVVFAVLALAFGLWWAADYARLQATADQLRSDLAQFRVDMDQCRDDLATSQQLPTLSQ